LKVHYPWSRYRIYQGGRQVDERKAKGDYAAVVGPKGVRISLRRSQARGRVAA
jgi:hypothetical protein